MRHSRLSARHGNLIPRMGNDMPKITDAEYEEYLYLKDAAERLEIFDSLGQITELEDDIDKPIKRCVAALALLGCEPSWSCCGFDYIGQPLHKHHQYGRIYFILGGPSERFIKPFCEITEWEYALDDKVDFRIDVKNVIEQWDNARCIHYYEPFVCQIQHLETFLYRLSDSFSEEVVLRDTNGSFKKRIEHWQYPARTDWVIRKSDYTEE